MLVLYIELGKADIQSRLLALARLNLHKHRTHILANNKSEILQKKKYHRIISDLLPSLIQLAAVGQRLSIAGNCFADDSVF